MPWTKKNPPKVALYWTADEQAKCVSAANAALAKGRSDREAILACIGASGRGKSQKGLMGEENEKWLADTEGTRMADDLKAGIDLDAYRDKIGGAWRAEFKNEETDKKLGYPYVQTVLDDAVIVERRNRLFRYDYTIQDGEPAFGAPGEVQVKYMPAKQIQSPVLGTGVVPAKADLKAGKRMSMAQVEALQRLEGQIGEAQSSLAQILAWATYMETSPVLAYGMPKAADLAMFEGWAADWEEFEKLTEGLPLHLKAVSETDKGITIGGYMAVWGGPDNLDLHRDYFTSDTEFYEQYYTKAPALFHHGQDPKVGKSVLGHRDDAYKDANGLWVQDWIDKSNGFWQIIEPLLKARKLYYSPGSVPHLVSPKRTNAKAVRKIEQYPIVDDTLTCLPIQATLLAERSLDYIKSAYADAGETLDFEPLRGKGLDLSSLLTGTEDQQLALAQAKLRLKRAQLVGG